ncbi:putative Cholesterol 7-alpha-monooxygenase [Glarea lozoyensis 74030]|uniref:Putative Cholesterol 7-alpha-monooxygenase n=1 Tax=Glarea lozoyensis (strain ATCC 74030 / MF5533) TaxID=1104152 RepID=H0EJ48_GLAL7|nr:putative Cholesterol 7-alpha-monooxygenase [Glarea lozoyensis 74030]
MFWLLFFIYSNPALLNDIRAELDPTLETSKNVDGSLTRLLDLTKVKSKCPLLASAFQETLRHRGMISSVRQVMEDTILDGKYLLKKDALVQMPARVVHMDAAIWGPDVEEFNPHRFLRSSNMKKASASGFRAFGGGTMLCPGRHFATTEILAMVAMCVVRFELKPVTGKWTMPTTRNTGVAAAVMEPDQEVEVEVSLRKGFEEGTWRFGLNGKVEVKYYPCFVTHTSPATLTLRLMRDVSHLPEDQRKRFLDDVFTLGEKCKGISGVSERKRKVIEEEEGGEEDDLEEFEEEVKVKRPKVEVKTPEIEQLVIDYAGRPAGVLVVDPEMDKSAASSFSSDLNTGDSDEDIKSLTSDTKKEEEEESNENEFDTRGEEGDIQSKLTQAPDTKYNDGSTTNFDGIRRANRPCKLFIDGKVQQYYAKFLENMKFATLKAIAIEKILQYIPEGERKYYVNLLFTMAEKYKMATERVVTSRTNDPVKRPRTKEQVGRKLRKASEGLISFKDEVRLDTPERRSHHIANHADYANQSKRKQEKKKIASVTKLVMVNPKARIAKGLPLLSMMEQLEFYKITPKCGDPNIYGPDNWYRHEYLAVFSVSPDEIAGTWCWEHVEKWITKNRSSFRAWIEVVAAPVLKGHEEARLKGEAVEE